MKNQRFFADGYVPRSYRSAVVLEEYLKEINQPVVTKWCKKVLHDYVSSIKDIRETTFKRSKEFYGKLVLKHYLTVVNKQREVTVETVKRKGNVLIPEFVLTLMENIMRTKFKVDILLSKK